MKAPLLLMLLLAAFTGCSPDNTDETPGNKTKTQLITQSYWTISKYETRSPSTPWVTESDTWAACAKDDRVVFRTNGTFESNDGVVLCGTGTGENGTWVFQDSETKVAITTVGAPRVWTIEQLDEHTLVLYMFNPMISEKSTFTR